MILKIFYLKTIYGFIKFFKKVKKDYHIHKFFNHLDNCECSNNINKELMIKF